MKDNRHTILIEIVGPMVDPGARPIMGDSLLAFAATRDAGLSGPGNEETFEPVLSSLPVRKVKFGGDWLYAMSQGEFVNPHSRDWVSFSLARTYERYSALIEDPGDLAKMFPACNAGNGMHKVGRPSLPILFCDAVRFVVDTDDPKRVLRLLSTITHVGKKTSFGMGKVRDGGIAIERTPGAVLRRPLPADCGYKLEGAVFDQRLRPAYFLPHGRHLAGTGSL